jgi:ubiquinone/menaquinone biosynthesis C-methylase UbiE
MEPERPSTVAFDRAIAYYDRTRGLSNAAMDRIGAILQSELRGHRCLEAGIGTGRIGVPLLERGVDLVGLDLSLPMLLKLREKRRDSPIVQGDVTRLPFGGRTFDRVLAVHLLHLIPNWRAMLDEVVRVLAPGGALVMETPRVSAISGPISLSDSGTRWGSRPSTWA